MKNVSLLLFITLSFSSIAQAQTSGGTSPNNGAILGGTVLDSTSRKPVAFATVALLNGTTVATGTTTNEQGLFSLTDTPPGSYTLAVSFVGYRTTTRPDVRVKAGRATDVGTVLLQADAKTLGAVNVVAQKPLIEDKGDRLVYNAENDLANTGGTAIDVMRKVPMLSVDLNGNLKMRGSSNIKVLVNGKPSSIMARNLADALKQMPANSIRSVEVITSPGAKYDAEGSAGVINIITKKAVTGTNGSVNATGGNLNRGLGLNLTTKGQKLGFSTQLNGNQYRNINSSTSTRTTLLDGRPAGVLFQQSSQDNTILSGNGTLSLDYDPDSLNRISLSATAWGGNYPNNTQLYTRQTDTQGAVVQEYNRDIRHRNPFGNTEFNLGWTRSFRQPGREFSVLSQYSRTPDNYFYTIGQTTPSSDATTYLERATNYSRNKEYTLQTDYSHPVKLNWHDTTTAKFEVGAKTIRRDIGSDYVIESSATGRDTDYAIDPNRSNQFTYNQQITSGYASVKLDTKSKWSLTMGTRFEHTRIAGDFPTTSTSFSNAYNNLIPNVTLAKTVRESHTIKASYTQRISRPLIWYLNPYRDYTDARNVRTGNPYLNPELTHATEVSYSTFNKAGSSLNAALYWRQTNNSIEYLTTVDAQGIGLSGPQNIGRNTSYGLNINGVWQPNKSLSVTVGTNVTYIDLISRALSLRNRGWLGNFSATISHKLPHGLTLETTGSFYTGEISLQSTYGGFYFYGLSAKKELMSKKASLTLNINNPFTPTNVIDVSQSATTFLAQQRLAFVNQSFRLTFAYTFGSASSNGNKTSRKISNDDAKSGR